MLDSSEAILIEYDPTLLSYSEIMDMWSTKFATFRSKPGKRQYRHVLFCQTVEEREAAIVKIRALETTSPVHVTVEDSSFTFYRAEEHHQDFFIKGRAKIETSNRLRMNLGMF